MHDLHKRRHTGLKNSKHYKAANETPKKYIQLLHVRETLIKTVTSLEYKRVRSVHEHTHTHTNLAVYINAPKHTIVFSWTINF